MTSECIARFWNRADKGGPNGCWLWTGAKNEKGYGVAWDGRRTIRAHRLAWLLTRGSLPAAPLILCHRCDTPGCVNPEHLFAGTNLDNQRDSAEKGRRAPGPVGGEKHRAVLPPETVVRMRALAANGNSAPAVAAAFGVHPETARKIIARRTYKNVEA